MFLFVHEFVTKSPVEALNKWVAATSAGIGVWTQIRDHPFILCNESYGSAREVRWVEPPMIQVLRVLLVPKQRREIFSICAVGIGFDNLGEASRVVKPFSKGHLFGTSNPHPGSLLDHSHKLTSLKKVFGCSSVQPGNAPPHLLDVELAYIKISAVDVCYLKFIAA